MRSSYSDSLGSAQIAFSTPLRALAQSKLAARAVATPASASMADSAAMALREWHGMGSSSCGMQEATAQGGSRGQPRALRRIHRYTGNPASSSTAPQSRASAPVPTSAYTL